VHLVLALIKITSLPGQSTRRIWRKVRNLNQQLKKNHSLKNSRLPGYYRWRLYRKDIFPELFAAFNQRLQ